MCFENLLYAPKTKRPAPAYMTRTGHGGAPFGRGAGLIEGGLQHNDKDVVQGVLETLDVMMLDDEGAVCSIRDFVRDNMRTCLILSWKNLSKKARSEKICSELRQDVPDVYVPWFLLDKHCYLDYYLTPNKAKELRNEAIINLVMKRRRRSRSQLTGHEYLI